MVIFSFEAFVLRCFLIKGFDTTVSCLDLFLEVFNILVTHTRTHKKDLSILLFKIFYLPRLQRSC